MTNTNEPITWQEELNNKRLCEGGWYGCIAPDGWKDTVLEADALLAYMDPDYKIQQIKEKFGTLRYYFSTKKTGPEKEIMRAIASAAESRSRTICEVCSGYGEIRDDRNWIVTLCNKCNDKRNAEIEARRAKL